MKIKNYFCLSVFLLLLVGCVDDYVGTSKKQKDAEANPNDFSLQEAHEFFDKAMEFAPVTRSGERLRSDGVSFPTGEFTVCWDDARKGQREEVVYYDFPIETQMHYKVRRMIKNTEGRKSFREVSVYQRLMVMKDLRRQKRAVYIVTFIPDSKSTGKVRCERFMRRADNGHYSGVVLYLNPYDYRPVRVDRYKGGVQTGGVFLSGNVKDAVSKVRYAQELRGNIQVASRQAVSPMTLDENDDEWDWEDSELEDNGDGTWNYHGEDADGNEHDYTLIDTDGDGAPDSVFIDPNPPYDSDPGSDTDWGDWNDWGDVGGNDDGDDGSSELPNPPVDPNPGGSIGGGGGSGSPSRPTQLPTIRLTFSASNYPGYGNGLDCMGVCKVILNKMLGSWNEVQRYQLYKEKTDGSLQLVGNPTTAFEMMNESLEQKKPLLVGIHYRQGSPNSDETTDHFVVIIGRGYDDNRQQYYYNYIETGRYKESANEALSNKNRLYYDVEKGTFSGEKWNKRAIYNIVQIRQLK